MPSSLLFGVNSEGRIHSLSTTSSAWREMRYVGLDFKRLSAVPHFLWAVCGDRQVYVHVHGLDVPIRVKEETYENERWLPLEGFSNRLFPTDRYHFSSADGTVDRSQDKIRLPSMAWQWESDWHLETTLNGQPLDHDGWTYAVDFPAQYHPKKQWKSCVRRRKWVRYRRYSAMNSWCAVAPLHKDATQEPFIDVSIGGSFMAGSQSGILLVWAVTAHGRVGEDFKVMFRTGVSTTSPEGLRWTNVQTPPGCEVNQISVGPTGLVWVVLLNGRALVRSGVTRDNPSGESWLEVRPPGDGLKLIQVSVGYNTVWGVTNDNRVWFRKGINGDASGKIEDSAIGSGWVEMVGNMAVVSVAPNDQVWGIGNEDRCLYFRAGVNTSDLTGKTWRLVQAPMQLSRASSAASLGLSGPLPRYHHSLKSKHRSWSSLNRPQSTYSEPPSSLPTEWEETSRSAPTPTSLRIKQEGESFSESSEGSELPQQPSHSESPGSNQGDKATPEPKGEPFIVTGKHFEHPIKSSRAWSPVRSVGSVVGTEANPESDVWETESGRDSGVFPEEDDSLAFYWTECDAMWTWVVAGACTVDPQALPNWFLDIPSLPQMELNEPWRIELLEELRKRLPESDYSKYEAAIDMSSWVKRGEARCLPRGSSIHATYEECIIEMEWISNSNGAMHSGTLTVLNPDGATTKMQFSVSEITCVLCCSEPGNPKLAIYTPKLPNGSSPLRIQFASDTELEDWLANLTSVCCQMNEVHGKPSDESIWITTTLGDVFVYDPSQSKVNQQSDNFYSVELESTSKSNEPYRAVLQNSFPPTSSITITGSIDDHADRISFNLECYPILKVRHKAESEVRDVPFHFNPRFDTNVIVQNTMRNGKWDKCEERDSEMVLQPGLEFVMKIVCENEGYRVYVHGKEYCFYKHRISPESIYQLVILGKLTIFKVSYKSKKVIIAPQDMFWRQMGGHLRSVESCPSGVVWGIGYDNTAWVYSSGWGGSFLKGIETSNSGINQMSDSQNYYVYENQRWNPVTGYTSTGLPTDRHMWSDITGKHKRTRDHAKLLSMHWQWISEWLVDFQTPGGVDRDGWQYAVDFPSKYHPKKSFTDMVRRRRWCRRARLLTSGPWHEVGNSKIIDISLQTINDDTITVWAVATNGDALLRKEVTKTTPAGTHWEHVACDQPLCSISAGPQSQVWSVGKNGSAYWRFGITSEKPEGEVWNNVEAPAGSQLKQIAVGYDVVWGLDTNGRLCVRREITPMFPEGTHWQTLPSIPSEQNSDVGSGFRQVSVGNLPDQVWAITNSGVLCKRCGISEENPAGNGWIFGINGTWHHVCVKSWSSLN